MKKTSVLPLAIVTCVTLALSACNQKSNADADAAKNQQMQALQAKIDALSARSDDLSKQISDRDAADQAAKRQQLTDDQADLDRQKEELQADRNALAKSTPEPTQTREVDDADTEPVYQGKPADDDLFYTKLQNDGNWIESQDYGYIWQPAVAVRNDSWRPYTDGRWVDTDRGWTWNSNERFGWATYHYGRWVDLDGSGWCWVPGHEWAPAWVSWRSSDRYVGWAPLPPEARLERGGRIDARTSVGYNSGPGNYNFVDTQDFGEDTYVGRVVAPSQNIAIINQTTNVTNLTYNKAVINNYGPDYDRIGQRSRRPVNRYRLDLQRNAQFSENATSPQVRGDRLAMVAPVMAAPAAGQNRPKPARVEKKIVQTNRENGWKNVNPAQRQAVQAEIQKQANGEIQRQQAANEERRTQQNHNQQQANRTANPPAAVPAGPTARKEPPASSQNPAQDPRVIAQRQAQQNQAAQNQAAQKRAAQQQQAQRNRQNPNSNLKPNPPAPPPSTTAAAPAPVQPAPAQPAEEKPVQAPEPVERPAGPDQSAAARIATQEAREKQQEQAQRQQQAQLEQARQAQANQLRQAEAQRQQAAGQAARQAQQQQQARQDAEQAQRARNQAAENQREEAARRQPGLERPRQPENEARPAQPQPGEEPAGKRADRPEGRRESPKQPEKTGEPGKDPEKQPQ